MDTADDSLVVTSFRQPDIQPASTQFRTYSVSLLPHIVGLSFQLSSFMWPTITRNFWHSSLCILSTWSFQALLRVWSYLIISSTIHSSLMSMFLSCHLVRTLPLLLFEGFVLLLSAHVSIGIRSFFTHILFRGKSSCIKYYVKGKLFFVTLWDLLDNTFHSSQNLHPCTQGMYMELTLIDLETLIGTTFTFF